MTHTLKTLSHLLQVLALWRKYQLPGRGRKLNFMSFSCEIHFFPKAGKMPDNLSYSFSSVTLKSQITTGYTKKSNRKTKCKDERR